MSHLTESDRLTIEHGLSRKMSLQELADELSKSRSTILREIRNHRTESLKGATGRVTNRCVARRSCAIRSLCHEKRCHRQCSACSHCNKVCPEFKEEECLKLSHLPYVCNGCSDEHKCVLRKQYYLAFPAQKEYRKLLQESRKGANLTEDEKSVISHLIYTGTQKGQSVHHITTVNRDSFNVCEKTIYRYVNSGIIRTRRGDLPRACNMKPRKRKNLEHKVDSKCRINRTYDDFKKYCEEHSDLALVEMDSVFGGTGGKVLLTIQFNCCGLMLAFLRDANNSQSVIDVFNRLEEQLTIAVFHKLFPVILTDNGSEFSNPTVLENSPLSGVRRTSIFYCNPYSSWQKGHVENNHTNLRKVLPKGRSLANFTQEDINIVLSHLNSLARKSLNDVPAITLFEALYGKEILPKLGIKLIDPSAVHLLPDLIKK
mgnify:CR=1 FL=1